MARRALIDPAALQVGRTTLLRHPRAGDEAEFLALVRESRALHRGRAHPPATPARFARWLARQREPNQEIHVLCRLEDGALCGVLNLSEIVRGALQGAYLGYYAFAPRAGQGYMREGMQLVLAQAFGRLKLHRVEANIQPDNAASIGLAVASGFRHEGYSPRYLKIGGRWRDHLRFAICREDWQLLRPRRGPRRRPA